MFKYLLVSVLHDFEGRCCRIVTKVVACKRCKKKAQTLSSLRLKCLIFSFRLIAIRMQIQS